MCMLNFGSTGSPLSSWGCLTSHRPLLTEPPLHPTSITTGLQCLMCPGERPPFSSGPSHPLWGYSIRPCALMPQQLMLPGEARQSTTCSSRHHSVKAPGTASLVLQDKQTKKQQRRGEAAQPLRSLAAPFLSPKLTFLGWIPPRSKFLYSIGYLTTPLGLYQGFQTCFLQSTTFQTFPIPSPWPSMCCSLPVSENDTNTFLSCYNTAAAQAPTLIFISIVIAVVV